MRMRVALVAVALLCVAPALAEWSPGELPLNPDLHAWFMAQRSMAGAVCCDEGDGAPAEAWEIGPNGYRVTIYGRTFDVPATAVDPAPNIMGGPIVWTSPLGSKEPLGVRCFLPGAAG